MMFDGLLNCCEQAWEKEGGEFMEKLQVAAQKGNPEMLLVLADVLRAEPGVTQSKLREIYLLHHYRGRNSGSARLQNRLGILYLTGIGCRQNIRKGCNWVKKAAKQGYPPAAANMMELESVISDTAVQEKLACGSVGLYTERIHDLLSPEEWGRNLMKMLE